MGIPDRLRRLGPAADVTFGARVDTLQGELTFEGPDVTASQDQTWLDPLVCVMLHSPRGSPTTC